MPHATRPGSIEVIAGVMFSGKSEELIRRVRRGVIARRSVQVFKSHLDARYAGQSYELTVPLALPVTQEAVAAAVDAFHAAHAQRYGYALSGETVEVVTVRVRGDGPGLALGGEPGTLHGPDASAAQMGVKPVWFGDTEGNMMSRGLSVWQRPKLWPASWAMVLETRLGSPPRSSEKA